MSKSILYNIGWSSLGGVITQLLNLLTLFILAKQLPPEVFGILAMLTIFINLSNIIVNSGFSQALIQNSDLQDSYYSTVFWLNLAMGILLYTGLIALSGLIASFFNQPELIIYFPIALLPLLITSLFLVHQSILEKNMRFKARSKVLILERTIGSVISIIMAYSGYGIWSLIWPNVLVALLTAIGFWCFARWQPKLHFSIQEARELFGFGAFLSGSQILGYFSRKLDDILIGKYMTTADLGVYSVAYRILMFPISFIKSTVDKVLFPAFSKEKNLEKLKSMHNKATEKSLILIVPFMSLIFVLNKDLINLVLGSEWNALPGVLTIFSITAMIISIGYPIQVLYALGKSKEVFRITVYTRTVLFLLISTGVYFFDSLPVITAIISIGLIQHNMVANIAGSRAVNQSFSDFIKRHVLKIILPYLSVALIIYILDILLIPYTQAINIMFIILIKFAFFVILTLSIPGVRVQLTDALADVRKFRPKKNT